MSKPTSTSTPASASGDTRLDNTARIISAPIINRAPVRREVQPPTRRVGSSERPSAATSPIATGSNAVLALPGTLVTVPTAAAGAAGAAATPTAPTSSAVPAVRRAEPRQPGVGTRAAAGGAIAAGAGAASAGHAGPAAGEAPPGASSGQSWTAQEIEQAKAHCVAVLRGVDATLAPEDPIKEGECGSPVVYKVSTVGRGPVVELSPPVTLTCDMVAALDKWMKREVQPKARAMLGGSIVKIDTMSSYSCRNAYGRTMARLSEHGKANAIDIAGFSTGKETTTVLAGWGTTERELRAIAAAKARTEQATRPAGILPADALSAVSDRSSVLPLPGLPSLPQSGLGLVPARLGGPKAPDAKAAPALPDGDAKRRFLHDIHATACKIFGTVLGPEANNAHKNHFHLDMAQRRSGSFCE